MEIKKVGVSIGLLRSLLSWSKQDVLAERVAEEYMIIVRRIEK